MAAVSILFYGHIIFIGQNAGSNFALSCMISTMYAKFLRLFLVQYVVLLLKKNATLCILNSILLDIIMEIE